MRLHPVRASPAPLFVYGTLMFPDVLGHLLGRVPELEPAQIENWRAASIEGQVFPVLVQAPGATTRGLVVRGLTEADWDALDDYEDTFYEIATVVTVGSGPAWTYTAPADLSVAGAPPVSPVDWDALSFARTRLIPYLERLRAT